MCTNATKTAAELMAAIKPTLESLLSDTSLLNTPEGQAAIAAFDAAETAVGNWQTGSPAENVLELVMDFQSVFNTLPLPADVEEFTNLILGGVEAVIGVLEGNGTLPAVAEVPADADATPEELMQLHQEETVAKTTAKIQVLVPGFKRSKWQKASTQYTNYWNSTAEKANKPQLKVA